MYLNRFAIRIEPKDIPNKFGDMIENFLFFYMPRKVNLGGYGFFCLTIHTSEQGTNEVSAYGQCVDFHYRDLEFQAEKFINSTLQEQFYFILQIIERTLEELNATMEIDKDKFDIALKACRSHFPLKEEHVLKVSKWHKSKKLKVDFVRILELTGENICYRIIDKNNAILKEQLIKANSSIYDASYDFRNSKWENNILLVFDRFDRQKLKLDLSEYLNDKEI